MQHVKHLIRLAWVFVCLSGMAWGDSGERALKPEEKAFMQATYKAAMPLMPEAPAGWTRKPVALSLPRWLGEGSELNPVPMEIVCDYQKNRSEITSSGSSSLGNTFLFFGTYDKKRLDDRLEIYEKDHIPPSCKVHRVMLLIDASPEVADRLISRMDLQKVAGLINLHK